jgi:hypothetical protein
MRVAILALSLFGIVISHASAAQIPPATEVPAFSSAVPAVAMNAPTFNVPELVAPAGARPGFRRGPVTHNASPATVRSPRLVMDPSVRHALAPSGALRALPQPARSLTDHLLTGLVALMLIGYQLRRKHRVLRPHPFTT